MATKLFVAGLPYSTSSERLRETFVPFGSVESASVVTDRDTGRSRGFGFVEMATAEEAKAAVGALNGTELDARRIRRSTHEDELRLRASPFTEDAGRAVSPDRAHDHPEAPRPR